MTEQRDRDTLIVNNSGGSTGWIFAVIIAVVLAFGAWFILSETSIADQTNISVDVQTPAPDAPEAPEKNKVPAE